MSARLIMKLDVVAMRDVGGGVREFTLRHPRRPSLPPPSPGAHVDMRLPDGGVRQYSLCGDPADASQYVIAVKREDAGRGGSRWIHENLSPGATAHVSAPRNLFRLAAEAAEHVLVAGGIGITPLLAMARHLMRERQRFVLHYCARGADTAPLLADARRMLGDRLVAHMSDAGPEHRFDAGRVLADRPPGAHVYCCGPARLVDAVRTAAAGWADSRVHVEAFLPLIDTVPPQPFDIEIASSGRTLHVPAERSALSVLRENGYPLPSSCEIGVCGTCECGYREGTVLHRDVVLAPAQRATRLLACVSRAEGRVLLDL